MEKGDKRKEDWDIFVSPSYLRFSGFERKKGWEQGKQ